MEIKELEDVLSTYKIAKPKYRNTEVENASLPFMLHTFSELIENEIPPQQRDFINNFKTKYPDITFKGIVSRLKRAYLSYVREYHLGYLLKEEFDNVYYDEDLDIAGVDFVITYKGKEFNVHAFVDTKNGRYWRNVKNKRHNFEGIHIDIPINLTAGKKVGEFILYTSDDVKRFIGKIDKEYFG